LENLLPTLLKQASVLLMPIRYHGDVLIRSYGQYARRWAFTYGSTQLECLHLNRCLVSGFNAANSLICRRIDIGCRSIAAKQNSSRD